jgi:hypothetical protein
MPISNSILLKYSVCSFWLDSNPLNKMFKVRVLGFRKLASIVHKQMLLGPAQLPRVTTSRK